MVHERRLFHVGLGAELRKLRELSRMSTRTVAGKLGTSPAWVSRTETGARHPRVDEVTALCALYGTTGEMRDRLIDKARGGNPLDGLPTGHEFADQEANVMLLEREAVRITDYGVSLVPGLMQTAEYARSIMSTLDRPRGEIEHRVATRLGRQVLLSKPNGPQLCFIIDELVLRRLIGGRWVMRRQLLHLLDCCEWSNVCVGVVPVSVGAYTGLEGPFTTYEFSALGPHVYMENRKGGVFLTDPAETWQYLQLCEELRSLALGRIESNELITELAEGLSDD